MSPLFSSIFSFIVFFRGRKEGREGGEKASSTKGMGNVRCGSERSRSMNEKASGDGYTSQYDHVQDCLNGATQECDMY